MSNTKERGKEFAELMVNDDLELRIRYQNILSHNDEKIVFDPGQKKVFFLAMDFCGMKESFRDIVSEYHAWGLVFDDKEFQDLCCILETRIGLPPAQQRMKGIIGEKSINSYYCVIRPMLGQMKTVQANGRIALCFVSKTRKALVCHCNLCMQRAPVHTLFGFVIFQMFKRLDLFFKLFRRKDGTKRN